jgi:hypothetical protein
MTRKRTRRRPQRGYPTAAERQLIIQRRDDLLKELIEIFVARPASEHTARINRLAQAYGAAEVKVVLDRFQARSRSPLVGEEPGLYREYRRAYARFGSRRRFLLKQEYEDLTFENAMLFAEREWKALLRRGPGQREQELRHLLLVDEQMWDDLFPLTQPRRPSDFAAPAASVYLGPVSELLELGWRADEQTIAARAQKASNWQPFAPDLERMVLDEGLLAGWPTDPPAWAPLHALRLLGYLGAHSSAGRLLALMDREEDWLSDLLPSVWANMGRLAAEPLWDYLQDRQHSPERRGNVLIGLLKLVEKHPQLQPEVVHGLIRLLEDAPAKDGEASAYLAHVLGELQATEALPALRRAYKAEKVDLKTMTWDDVMTRMRRA